MKTCMMTVSDDGKNGTGLAQYWQCGRPAVKKLVSAAGREIPVCKIHASSWARRKYKPHGSVLVDLTHATTK